jgi:DNA-binding beta-propeller fold protein YncE
MSITHSSSFALARQTLAPTLAATVLLAALTGCEVQRALKPSDIAGRYIVAIGDADMASASFGSRELGERDLNAQDALTVVTLPLQEPSTPFAQINVSNSALCPPTSLSVTRDGKFAFVVEYRGPADANARTVDDLPKGNKLTAVELADPLNPRVAAITEVGLEPIAVAAHPSGELVAVVTHAERQQIVLLPFKDGAFSGEPATWPVLGVEDESARPTSVAWHPGGEALAVTLQDRGEVAFFRFRRDDDGKMQLAPWGTPVKAGKSPHSGAFTPDGRHFIVNDTQTPARDSYGVGTPAGQLIVIRLGDMPGGIDTAEGTQADHIVVGTAPVGVAPVGIAITSDGKFVATANLQPSQPFAQPIENANAEPRQGDGEDPAPTTAQDARGGTVSLLALSNDGELTPVGEYPINAVPASLAFDAKDTFLVVTQFRSFDPGAIDGELSFWKLRRGRKAGLQMADFFVGVGKGPHGVLIVR